jgi:hypothetical protein
MEMWTVWGQCGVALWTVGERRWGRAWLTGTRRAVTSRNVVHRLWTQETSAESVSEPEIGALGVAWGLPKDVGGRG